jgi:septum formation protein
MEPTSTIVSRAAIEAVRARIPRDCKIVLASASPRRSAILAALGLEFEVRPADTPELVPPGVAPAAAARAIALEKLRAIAGSVDAGLVVAADTIVVVNGEILGKPGDDAAAVAMLEKLSGTTHEVITALALALRPGGREAIGHETTAVTMRPLAGAEIAAYVASGEPFGKAGGYAIQENGDAFVAHLDGRFDNVVGFPATTFAALLARLFEVDANDAEGSR